jgi:hypothetical protein
VVIAINHGHIAIRGIPRQGDQRPPIILGTCDGFTVHGWTAEGHRPCANCDHDRESANQQDGDNFEHHGVSPFVLIDAMMSIVI